MIALSLIPIGIVVGQRPELYVQTGHSGDVLSVAFSPDGKMLASGSVDNTIKLWDVAGGKELNTLKGHTDDVSSVVFSPDGKVLASGSWDYTIRLWAIADGSELQRLQGKSGWFHSIAFSPNGKFLASGCSDSTVKLWDVESGREIRTLIGHSRDVVSVAFSPDGRTLASGSWDGTIKLWDSATGQMLRSLESDRINSVAFRSDGKTLASGSADYTTRLWDLQSGQELKRLEAGVPSSIISVAFSPDGRLLAAGGDDIKLWDVAGGQEVKEIKSGSDGFRTLSFSPDGTLLAAASANTIKLWSLTDNGKSKTLKGHVSVVRSLVFQPDGKALASGTADNLIKLWDLGKDKAPQSFKGHSSDVTGVAFSPDGLTLASSSTDGSVRLWDLATGQQLRTFKGYSPVAFSPSGKILVSGGTYQTMKVWDVASGNELRALESGEHSDISSVAFSPDGNILAGATSVVVKLWDVASGRELRRLEGHTDQVWTVAFSPDGKTLATGAGENDSSIKLWDVSSGHELKTLKGHSGDVFSVAFSPDGKTLVSAGGDQTIKLWDVQTGQELKTIRGHSSAVSSVTFSPDGHTLASGSLDGKTNLWDVASGDKLASLIALDENDWMVIAPDGLFDGSPPSWASVVWRFGRQTLDVAPTEAFFNDYYYPGLLTAIFSGKRPRAPTDISQKDRRQPQLKIVPSAVQPASEVSARNIAIRIEVSQAPAGAQDVRLFRNGSLVKMWHGDVLSGRDSGTLEATVPIVAGENRLTAYAFNRDNIKSSDVTLTIRGADSLKRKGVAYLLAVGVNEYSNAQYNLKYAVADSQDFAAELKRQQAKLNNYERVEVISFEDKDATKATILKTLAALSGKVQPEDALIIFFAGHGTAQQNRFYLIPHDLGYTGSRTQLDKAGLQTILNHSISDEEISRAVEEIDAGQMLLVIDACNSGQALEAEEKRRGPMNSKGLAQLAYEKGMYILTAAQSYQAAKEAARLGHGFLTYALVEEGLKANAADQAPKDGQVLMREWLDFATERVPQMQQQELDQQKKQGRQLDRIKFVEADSGNDRNIQRPRVFYRRETESHPLVVAKP